jgi:hypothetical protein
MTPRKFRERLAETRERVDPDDVITALSYVRDDARTR